MTRKPTGKHPRRAVTDPVLGLYGRWRALVERYDAFDCDTDEDGNAEERARHAVLEERDAAYKTLVERRALSLAGVLAKLRALRFEDNMDGELVVDAVIADLDWITQETPPPAA